MTGMIQVKELAFVRTFEDYVCCAAFVATAWLPGQALAQAPQPTRVDAAAEEWTADVGSTLRAEVNKWAERANWTVIYDSSVDYPLFAELNFVGRFDQAVGKLIRLYERSARPLLVDISMSQRVVIITERRPR